MNTKTTPMAKVRIIGCRDDLPKATETLHRLGALEIRQAPADARLRRDAPLEDFAAISERLVRLRGIESHLTPPKRITDQKTLPRTALLKKSAAIASELDEVLGRITNRQREIQARRDVLVERLTPLRCLAPFDTDLSTLSGSLTDVFVVTGKNRETDEIVALVSAETTTYDVIKKEAAGHKAVLLFAVEKTRTDAILTRLAERGFDYLPPRDVLGFTGRPKDLIHSHTRELKEIGREETALDRELAELSKKHYATVAGLREMLEIEAARSEIPYRFGRTETLFVAEAWSRKDTVTDLRSALEKNMKNRIHLEEIDADEDPPVILDNPGPVAPFESLVEFFSLPKKGEPDPTIFLALGFPLLFGMMLGDAGYGVGALLVGGLIVKKTAGILADLGRVWAVAAIPTIVFGVVYDEYLGFAHHELLGRHLYAPPLERLHDPQSFLLLAIVTGILHLSAGFAIGFWTHRKHDRRHALGKLGWLAFTLAGCVLAATGLFATFPEAVMLPSAVIAAAGLATIVYAEGVFGLVEVPGLIGNILSYARIMAIGMSSIALALIVNNLFSFDDLGLSLLVTLPLFLTLHFANLVLGMFESSIQGIRLNYAEFFSKFYEGGGKPFTPFAYTRTTTTE